MTATRVSHISKGLLCCSRCATEAIADQDASEALVLQASRFRCTCNQRIAKSRCVDCNRSGEALRFPRLHIQACTRQLSLHLYLPVRPVRKPAGACFTRSKGVFLDLQSMMQSPTMSRAEAGERIVQVLKLCTRVSQNQPLHNNRLSATTVLSRTAPSPSPRREDAGPPGLLRGRDFAHPRAGRDEV